MKKKQLSFTAAGDMLVQRRLPAGYDGFQELADFIKKGDARYFNLETTINRGESWGNQYGGGSWLRADPAVLKDAKSYGFNMMSFANNHSLDFSHWGLLETIRAADESGLPHAGCGKNLAEASAPAYLDTPKGRVALIAVTTSFEAPSMAGEQTRRLTGRPGVNGVRHSEVFQVTEDQMEMVKKLAEVTNINGYNDILRAEGYLPQLPERTFALGKILFQAGDCSKRITKVHPGDMERVKKAIYEAENQSDYIIVAVHSHEIQGTEKETPDDFLVEFCHCCIDSGANAVVGHGPHLLRPVEIYKESPIFYSLGDFMLENENIPYAPQEFYDMYGLDLDTALRDLFQTRSDGFRRGLQTDHRAFETVVPYWETEGGRLKKLILMPVELGFGASRSMGGLPKPLKNAPFMERLTKMSKSYGTEIRITEDGLGEVQNFR